MNIEFDVCISVQIVIHGKLRTKLQASANFDFEEKGSEQFYPLAPSFYQLEYWRESDDEWIFVGEEMSENLCNEASIEQALLAEAQRQWIKNMTMAQSAIRFTKDD